MAALVGTTGSGKTTIIALLNRFYEIQKGEIMIDDIPTFNIMNCIVCAQKLGWYSRMCSCFQIAFTITLLF
ncbi:MAG: ATP-binding cassette domain-containing protein [Bacteroidetes bacterium]|nr:ATP-binding cassette domain-containing protein [Bacteroidota bacterium]